MAIQIRNKLTDPDNYRIIDVKVTGVSYNPNDDRTTLNVLNTDTNHDYVKAGQFVIPMRNESSPSAIKHPLVSLKVVGTFKDDASRKIFIEGNQLATTDSPSGGNGFFQNDSPNDTPYQTTGFSVSQIQVGRRYRITDVGVGTSWDKFGDLNTGVATTGTITAAKDVYFRANASGSGGDSPQIPRFDSPRVGAGGTRFHNSPEANYKIFGLTGDLSDVNGIYNYISSTLWRHETNNIAIQKRAGAGGGLQWAIYNPSTSQVFFEDSNIVSTSNRLDSPVSDTPQVSFEDRTATIASEFHGSGKVTEVAAISTIITDDLPLTNAEVDNNFTELEKTKVSNDGSIPINGNQLVRGKITADNLDITTQINVKDKVALGTNTFLNADTKDIECNNIFLSGEITDTTLFNKYKIVQFPHSFLAYYNTAKKALEPTTALFFEDVSSFTVSSNFYTSSAGKQFHIRRVNQPEGYILVSESTTEASFRIGETITSHDNAGPILKVLAPKNYLTPRQNIKIFGIQQRAETGYITAVDSATITMDTASAGFTVSKPAGGQVGTTSYTYRIALMDKRTGRISELTAVAADGSHTVQNQLTPELMDANNYNIISNVTRNNIYNIILLYRRLNGAGEYKLVNIFDNDEISGTTNITLNDYGLYDKTDWGVYTDTNGAYNLRTNPVYVPLTDTERNEATKIARSDERVGIDLPPVGNKTKFDRGFLETRVHSVITPTSNSPILFRIEETKRTDSPNINEATFDSPLEVGQQQTRVEAFGTGGEASLKNNEVEFFFDNGRIVDSPNGALIGGLQKLINDTNSSGTKEITLKGGTYYSKLITLPSNTKISGSGRTTTFVKQLPWNFTNTSSFRGGGKTNTVDSPKERFNYITETKTTGSLSSVGTIDRFQEATARLSNTETSGIFQNVMRGRDAYARVLIDADAKTNIELSNITLDGSLESNTASDYSITGKGNTILTIENAKDVFLNDMTIKNTALGGIYAENNEALSINNTIIRDGGVYLAESIFATGLYAPASSNTRMQSSLIENFSQSNDLTSNINTSFVGNIIRNTGSGVLAYASSNFNKAANLILGPADEFIPVVDTLNSEYDEININLLESGDFLSDIVEFRRNGEPLDMGPPVDKNDFGMTFDSEIKTLVSLGTQEYFLDNSSFNFSNATPTRTNAPVITIATNDTPSSDRPSEPAMSSGNFQLKVANERREKLSLNANFGKLNTDYESLDRLPISGGRPASESLVGLVYQVLGTEFLYLGADDEALSINQYSYTEIINDVATATFSIDRRFSGLISTSDRIVFTFNGSSGNQLNGLQYQTSGTDIKGRAIPVSYAVTGVNTDANNFNITIEIPSAQASGVITTAQSTTSEVGTGTNSRIGVRNTFSIAKGRIVV